MRYTKKTNIIGDGNFVGAIFKTSIMSKLTEMEDDFFKETYYSKDNRITNILYYLDWKLHNYKDIPAVTNYNEKGYVNFYRYFEEDLIHRNEDKPAIVYYNQQNNKYVEHYYKKGLRHRDNYKPAYIYYYMAGEKKYTYYINGIIRDEKEVQIMRKRLEILEKIV